MMWWEWLIWLVLCVGGFAILESIAFKHPDRQWTLSRSVAKLGSYFPLTLVVWGIFIGGLSVHFFWHFCP
jgi:hypothetical protein